MRRAPTPRRSLLCSMYALRLHSSRYELFTNSAAVTDSAAPTLLLPFPPIRLRQIRMSDRVDMTKELFAQQHTRRVLLIPAIISFEANNKKGKDKKNYDGAIVNSMTPFAALSFLGVADYKMCEEIRSAATFDKFWNLNTFPLWAVHGGSLYRHLLLLLFRAMESLSLSYPRVPLCSSPFYCEGGLVTSSMCRKMSAQERCKEVKKRKRKV